MNTQTAADVRAFHSSVPDEELAELPVPTYLGRGDPAGRFANYYPAWVDNLAARDLGGVDGRRSNVVATSQRRPL